MDKTWLGELHEDVLYWIFSHYCGLRDCIRMGAVCKSWLSISRWIRRSRPPQLPWLMMPSDNSMSAEGTKCFFNISEDTIYDAIKLPEIEGKRCCGSFNNADACGWLLTIDDENLEMGLFHPWRKIQLQLPNLSTVPFRFLDAEDDPLPAVMNAEDDPLPADMNAEDDPLPADMKIRTAAMSDDAEVVVIIYDCTFLAFCRIGEKAWTPIRTEIEAHDDVIDEYVAHDVIYHKGRFYAVSIDGSVGVLHINSARPYVEILSETIRVDDYPRTYLVADSVGESLIILARISPPIDEVEADPHNYDSRRTLGFKVYELRWSEETGEYKKDPVEVESLSDRLIFVGQNSSLLVMASQFPGFKGKGNHVYFTDDFTEASYFESPLGCFDLGIFNMEDKTTKQLFSDRFHPALSPSIWIVPPL